MEHHVEILHTGFVTHDVKRFVVSRPDDFQWEPGQGVELALDRDGWREEARPFTPTCLRDSRVLEFTIKGYPEHDGVTTRLHGTGPGGHLLMSEPFGTITWEGPGIFIAGGAGVTPFLAILRDAEPADLDGCALHFSNRTPADVICEKELRWLLGDRCHLTCTAESGPRYDDRRIDRAYLEDELGNVDEPVYLCGPPDFVDELGKALEDLGADTVVVEE